MQQSITSELKGLLYLFQLMLKTNELVTACTLPFSDVIYLLAAVLDPMFGFVWLEDGHADHTEVKRMLQ